MKTLIRGRMWTIKRARLVASRGECDDPLGPGRVIKVAHNLKGEEELEVIIHEMLHAGLWDLDESVVETMGEDMARALWKMGYRRTAH